MADDELDLATLSDDDLVAQMHDDLYDGLKEEIEQGVRILLGRDWAPYKVLTEALVEGMRIVGVDFRDGILFVPEVLMSANAILFRTATLSRGLIKGRHLPAFSISETALFAKDARTAKTLAAVGRRTADHFHPETHAPCETLTSDVH